MKKETEQTPIETVYKESEVRQLMILAFEQGFRKADVVEAGLEGKETDIDVNWMLYKYKLLRDTLQPKQKEYIPYTIEDIQEFIDVVVVTKLTDGDIFRKINKVDSYGVFLTEWDGTSYHFEYNELLEHHFKIDETPFGKLKND
jgi:hypothetical protein